MQPEITATGEAEVGGPQIQCSPGLQSKFGGSLAKSRTTKKDPVLILSNKLRKWF